MDYKLEYVKMGYVDRLKIGSQSLNLVLTHYSLFEECLMPQVPLRCVHYLHHLRGNQLDVWVV